MLYCKKVTCLIATLLFSLSGFSQTNNEELNVNKAELSPHIQELAKEISQKQRGETKSVDHSIQPVNPADLPPTINETINEIVDTNNDDAEKNKKLAQDFLKNTQDKFDLESNDIDNALKGPDYGKFGTNGDYGDSSMMSSAMAKAEQQARSHKETRYGEDVFAYIAVSMSMPDRWFRNMLTSLANEHKDKRVIIAFQGAKPGELAKFALAIEQAMPDTNEGSYSIVIDPTIFMRLNIDKVPTFVINTKNGWRKVLGELSLTQAETYALQDYEVYEALGRIYDIEEPNMITLLQKKMKEGLENDPVSKMTQKMQEFKPAIVELPVANESFSYLVTPIFTVEQDLRFEGTIFAKKGETVNTLEHLPLTDNYAFIDLSDPKQINQAREWRKQKNNLKIFSTTLPASSDMAKYVEEFGYISQVNSLLVERFHIEAIPSLAYQVGNQLKVEVADVDNGPKG